VVVVHRVEPPHLVCAEAKSIMIMVNLTVPLTDLLRALGPDHPDTSPPTAASPTGGTERT
jgi:hypothetical protein